MCATYRNYLRARGEYRHRSSAYRRIWELPPRTRRIPSPYFLQYFSTGTTSAHAENTMAAIVPTSSLWNYLRARGEYSLLPETTGLIRELPPRTRRIRAKDVRKLCRFGTTSAHAENTTHTDLASTLRWNYLRARGEYANSGWVVETKRELPPRTRRIQTLDYFESVLAGTTSAHAENTSLL